MSFWWSCPVEGFGRALNLLVNKFCPPSSPRTTACYIFCSWFLFSHLALSCFKTANPPESSAKSCWPRWLVSQSSRAQRGSGKDAAAHSVFLSCMEGGPDGRKSWLSLVHIRSSSIYLHLHFYPAQFPLHQQYTLISESLISSSVSTKC